MFTKTLDKRLQIVSSILNKEGEFSPKEISNESGVSYPTVIQVLAELSQDGLVIHKKHGRYTHTQTLNVVFSKLQEVYDLYKGLKNGKVDSV